MTRGGWRIGDYSEWDDDRGASEYYEEQERKARFYKIVDEAMKRGSLDISGLDREAVGRLIVARWHERRVAGVKPW